MLSGPYCAECHEPADVFCLQCGMCEDCEEKLIAARTEKLKTLGEPEAREFQEFMEWAADCAEDWQHG